MSNWTKMTMVSKSFNPGFVKHLLLLKRIELWNKEAGGSRCYRLLIIIIIIIIIIMGLIYNALHIWVQIPKCYKHLAWNKIKTGHNTVEWIKSSKNKQRKWAAIKVVIVCMNVFWRMKRPDSGSLQPTAMIEIEKVIVRSEVKSDPLEFDARRKDQSVWLVTDRHPLLVTQLARPNQLFLFWLKGTTSPAHAHYPSLTEQRAAEEAERLSRLR